MISVREFASRSGASERTIRLQAQQGKFAGAEFIEPPAGVPYWLIPETALDGFEARGRGRPPKTKAVGLKKDKG